MHLNTKYAPEKRAARTMRGTFRAIGWFIVVYFGAQTFESIMFPVAWTEWIKVESRTDERLCIRHKVHKYRHGLPRRWVWDISDWDRDNSNVSMTALNPDDGEPFEEADTTKKGEVRIYRQCFPLPNSLQGAGKALIISARGEYIVNHGLWTVPRTVGPYMVWEKDVIDWR